MFSAVGEIAFRLRNRGVPGVTRWIVDRLRDKALDRAFGIVSAPRKKLKDFGIENPEYVDYQAVSYRDLREMLAWIEIKGNDGFLDLGCGMGRAICVAAMQPFRSVIGVEISPDLTAIARSNLKRLRPRFRCGDVRVVRADAAAYAIPAGISVVMLFNPFSGGVLGSVLDNIAESARKAPRTIHVLFYGTVSTEEFGRVAQRAEFLRLQEERKLSTGAVMLHYTASVQ